MIHALVTRTRDLFEGDVQPDAEQPIESDDRTKTKLFNCSGCGLTYISESMDACSNCGAGVESVPDKEDLGWD